ncbi:Uncharacterised protein [uncultured archaeon]|nr:Uncharacterised protein [uncultured archaeon]
MRLTSYLTPMNFGENPSEEIAKLKGKIKYYSPEELLSQGKEFAENSEYFKANIVFEELIDREGKKELAELYLFIVSAGLGIEAKEGLRLLTPQTRSNLRLAINQNRRILDNLKEFSIESVISCMVSSRMAYEEGKLPKEEVLCLEKLVDQVIIQNPDIKQGEEFKKLYCRFKEYCLNIFVSEK